MCMHVNGLDSLAVDHHRQALAAALLSHAASRSPQLQKTMPVAAPAPLRKSLRVFMSGSRLTISTERPEQRDVIRSLAISFVCPNKFKAVPTAVPHVPTLEGPLRSR